MRGICNEIDTQEDTETETLRDIDPAAITAPRLNSGKWGCWGLYPGLWWSQEGVLPLGPSRDDV